MNNLDELDSKIVELKKTRDELIESLNKNDDEKEIEEKLDEHNEKKHGEDKDEDSAMKAEDGATAGTKYAEGKIKSWYGEKSTASDKPRQDKWSQNKVKDLSAEKVKLKQEAKDIKKGCNELIKFDNNQQWSLND